MDCCTVKVNTEKPYSVIIENGALSRCGEIIAQELKPCRVAVISDDTVSELYGDEVRASLKSCGFSPVLFSFPPGESSKSPETLYKLLNQLGEASFDRDDSIIALGGGVTGDIAGFASAIYKRGLPLVQLPTTLLSMADSSVGGKTAVNMPCGKNMLGAFKQPELVICDAEALESLSDAQFSCGMAEIIKCSMLCAAQLPAAAFPNGRGMLTGSALREIIYRSVSIKAELVSKDELDRGERKLLNFGHTFGHAIESASGYELNHGQAVALGMLIITHACEISGSCTLGTARTLEGLLKDFGLPAKTDMTAEKLIPYIYEDKKRTGDSIDLVVPIEFGRCVVEKTSLPQVERLLRMGLEAMG